MVKEKISEKELKHKSRRLSIKEGIFASAKTSFGDRFVQPFAIAIKSSSSMVALLTSIAGLLGPLSQLTSSNLFEKQSRKKTVLRFVFIEALMWLPFIAIAILFFKGIYLEILPTILLLSFSIYIIIGNAPYPAWFSWMGDIVDKKYRGRWFSKRIFITSFVTVIIAIGSSFFLDYFNKIGIGMIGFSILFCLAFVSRLMAWATFKKQYEPKLNFEKKNHFSFTQFLKEAPKNNFGKFTIFRTLFVFTGTIFSSLFAVYLLRYLGFNYSTYIVITISEVIFSLAVMNFWGNFADKYGNYTIMAVSTIIIPLMPVIWILSPSPIYLIFVPALISGVVWAGFRLATENFVYDNVQKEKRGLAISYYNMMLGMGIFMGGLVSAGLIRFDQILSLESIFFIFMLSTITRMIVVLWWLPKIKEVRKTEKFSPSGFGKKMVKRIKPAILEEIHEIASIKGYLKD